MLRNAVGVGVSDFSESVPSVLLDYLNTIMCMCVYINYNHNLVCLSNNVHAVVCLSYNQLPSSACMAWKCPLASLSYEL